MNKHIKPQNTIHAFIKGKEEGHTDPVLTEQYLMECESQLVQKQQFLKILALSFHNFLLKSYRNLHQKSEPDNRGCCNFEQELRQAIIDHESKLALYFDSDITKSLGLTTQDRNHLKGN